MALLGHSSASRFKAIIVRRLCALFPHYCKQVAADCFHCSGSCHDRSYRMRFFDLAGIRSAQYARTAFPAANLNL